MMVLFLTKVQFIHGIAEATQPPIVKPLQGKFVILDFVNKILI